MNKKIEQFKKTILEKETELKDFAKKGFETLSKEIFELNPELISVSWSQYTPYFNDGDECTFSVHFYGEEDDFEFKDGTPESTKEKIIDLVSDFINAVPSETMKTTFGDHCQVTLTARGANVEDYSHD